MTLLRKIVLLVPLFVRKLYGTSITTGATTCSALLAVLGGAIIQPSDPRFHNASQDAWNLFNTQFNPSCVVFPNQSSDVVKAMTLIFHHECDYAVQAGGHSAMPGWNK
jgi:hypothetical protein